jgi:hypothetical protein
MSAPQHIELSNGKWQTMSLAEQLGNIGSEYSRASRWKLAGNAPYFEKAFQRLLELFDLTLSDSRWHGARRRELGRARSEVCEQLAGTAAVSRSLQKYFDAMAIAARR